MPIAKKEPRITVTISLLRDNLPEITGRVRLLGQEYTVTYQGDPQFDIVPHKPAPK